MSTPNTTPNDRDAALESLANRLREVQAGIKELKDTESDLKARIAVIVGDARGPIQAYGKDVLDVSYSHRFDPDLAASLLAGTDYWDQITETAVVTAKAKAILPPALYEACQPESDRPTIKPKAARP